MKNRESRILKKSKEKSLISLWKRKTKLFNAKRKLNRVELDKPIRSGYKKFFVLRDDFSRSEDAKMYLAILPYIQKTVYSRNDEFLTKDFKTKKWVDIQHNLSTISHKKWNEISETLSDKQKNLFRIFWRQTSDKNPKIGNWEYRLVKDFMFVPKVEPHYKTHSIVLDPDLESELKEIDNKIERNNLMPKLGKSLGWSTNYKDYYNETRRNQMIREQFNDDSYSILEYDQYN